MTTKELKFKEDLGTEDWLAQRIAEARAGGVNQWGVPKRMGSVTGRFTRELLLPTGLLVTLRGQRGEQSNPRPESLKYLSANWRSAKKKPVFIEVDPFGQPWVTEGNHRIMVAAAKEEPSVLADVQYLSGGQLRTSPAWQPEQLLAYDSEADAREAARPPKRRGKARP